MKPDDGVAGAVEVDGGREKNADGPLPRFHPVPFPILPGKLRPPRHCGRAGHDVARGERATGRCP
ncbi:MAG TPA: hypothetical protein VEQ60_12435, partial [Longimicrobium sp.]|nr:hypothetical protein [Longimicrobium sp.]